MEIERKWLVEKDRIPYNLARLEKEEIEQVYISFSPTIRIRNVDDREFFLTIKNSISDNQISREEFQFHISKEQYEDLYKKKEGNVIRKTRYLFRREDNLLEEIDVFHDDFEGLVYLEIEFPTVELAEEFKDPDWIKLDVTNIPGYSNSCLAKKDLNGGN